ncbi:MAG: 1-acyl-sn-glycerol-3-phosphate acyltransferase [Bacteroidetes bacterium]|nr:1-acyl-sn-glycerol-3-phosphate acyltransferase [Bacteroidota bacterium]
MISKYLGKLILKLMGWKTEYNIPKYDKCIAIMAPHTSNWDFVIGRLFYFSIGIKPRFLIKKEIFFFPLNIILRSLGGIPIDRSKSTSLVEKIIYMFNERTKFTLTITPEGTRKKVTNWKRGFYYISKKANVPIVMGYLDYKKKIAGVYGKYIPQDNVEEDIKIIKNYYKNVNAKHPEKFII